MPELLPPSTEMEPQTVRRSSLAGTLGAVLSAGLLAFAPSALASIVIGQSIAGVKLGASEAQVKAVLGPPTSNANGSLFYPSSVGLRIGITGGKVNDVLSFSKHQKTSKGITIGSSRAQMKRAYPQAKCAEGPYGPKSLYCAVLVRFHGRKSFTSFLFGAATGGVVEIELGYGVGLAQELKEQRKK